MKLHTIMGSANPENTSSCLMMERNGFNREGTLRQSWFFNGVCSDSAIYGMLEEDYFAKS
ncbi:MAG: N-acetyltransferase [Flavobacteriaceae bacterium]|nr:N-acetyltransferase [Flavobacteriaceae bacterium]